MVLDMLLYWWLLPRPQKLMSSIKSFGYPMRNSTASTSGLAKPKVCDTITYPKLICVLIFDTN